MSAIRSAYLCALAFLALAGCPQPAGNDVTIVPDDNAGSAPITNNSGNNTTPVTASGSALPSEDDLQQEFPSCEEPLDVEAWRAEILRLVNVERQRVGLLPVRHDAVLETQATQYACEMIHYDFFAHDNPVTGSSLRDRAEEFGYEFRIIGENLAAGQATPQQAMADWMNSTGHRENILNEEFTELGVGVRTGGEYGIYWVQEFGRPR